MEDSDDEDLRKLESFICEEIGKGGSSHNENNTNDDQKLTGSPSTFSQLPSSSNFYFTDFEEVILSEKKEIDEDLEVEGTLNEEKKVESRLRESSVAAFNMAIELRRKLREQIVKIDELLERNSQKQKIVNLLRETLRGKKAKKRKIYNQEYLFKFPHFQSSDENDKFPPDHPLAKEIHEALDKTRGTMFQRKWSENDDRTLRLAVETHRKRKFLRKLVADAQKLEETSGKILKPRITLTKEVGRLTTDDHWKQKAMPLQETVDELDWVYLTHEFFRGKKIGDPPRRNGIDCKTRWNGHLNPVVKHGPWSRNEDKMLLDIVEEFRERDWESISKMLKSRMKVESFRTPFNCFRRYQRSHNTKVYKRDWTKEEDENLKRLFEKYGRNWNRIASEMPGRNTDQVFHRWQKRIRPGIRRHNWTLYEDLRLRMAHAAYGGSHFSRISHHLLGRTDIQIKERWDNVLKPGLNKDRWTTAEDNKLLLIVAQRNEEMLTGLKWSQIAKQMPGRTDNQCWRRWKAIAEYKAVENYNTIQRIKSSKLPRHHSGGRSSFKPSTTPLDYVSLADSLAAAGAELSPRVHFQKFPVAKVFSKGSSSQSSSVVASLPTDNYYRRMYNRIASLTPQLSEPSVRPSSNPALPPFPKNRPQTILRTVSREVKSKDPPPKGSGSTRKTQKE